MLLAMGLGGLVYFYEFQIAPRQEEAKANEEKVFSFDKQQIKSFTIKTKDKTLKFEQLNQKPGDNSRLSPWQMKAPIDTPASDASVSYLLDVLVDGKKERTFTVAQNQLKQYGLDKPQVTIEVTLKNQQTHHLILGNPDFNHSFLYAEADPQAKTSGQLEVLIVSTDFENAVKRPLSEWKAKSDSKKDNSHKSSK